jgi:hypothetical protein
MGDIPLACGLPELADVSCYNINNIDLSTVVYAYPKIKSLSLLGKHGFIHNFKAIVALKNLSELYVHNLFGFTKDDIPKPEELPRLHSLCMEEIPEDAAKMVQMLYKNRVKEGFDLKISKARKPEWIVENMDNPFRGWDDSEFVSPANAKKAGVLYKKTRNDIMALVDTLTGSNEASLQASIEAIVTAFTEAFNHMNKRSNFIETDEREDIYAALCALLKSIPDAMNIDRGRLDEIFDNIRNF